MLLYLFYIYIFLVCLGMGLSVESGCLSVFRYVFGCVCVCVLSCYFLGFCNNCRFLILSPKIFSRKFGQMCFYHFTRKIFVVQQ